MDIQTVDSTKMEALKSLAETNLKVSNAKVTLAEIKNEHNAYIKKREEKVLDQIKAIIDQSQKILDEAYANYEEVHDLSKSVDQISTFIFEAHSDLLSLNKLFDERSSLWEKDVAAVNEIMSAKKKQILVDQTLIKNDQDSIKKTYKAIAVQKRKLQDDRETMEREIERFKKRVK